jgi:hypothetical protein
LVHGDVRWRTNQHLPIFLVGQVVHQRGRGHSLSGAWGALDEAKR